MITVSRRNIFIPQEERVIGFYGDSKVNTVSFYIQDPSADNYTYVLYIEFEDGRTNSVLLERENNLCMWQIKAEHIFSSGIAFIQIKAISENDEIWHSPKATVEIFESIEELSGQYSPTVLQQLDDKINEVNAYADTYITNITQQIVDQIDTQNFVTQQQAHDMISESIDELVLPLNRRLDGENPVTE